MSAQVGQHTARYGWYGDDFTGATDTLATWAERGRRAMLFMGVPGPAQLAAAGPLDAIGIAGATRSMAPEAAAVELDAAGRFFAEQSVEILHYKCCSTFDSAPHVGNIGAAVRALQRHFPNPLVPIVGGQPNLGRYCLFGTLFAAAGAGGDVYRIDRHPTMSVHPVTPMGEADLRKHFAKQGLERIGLIEDRAYACNKAAALLDECLAARPGAVLFDVVRAEDLANVGRLILQHAARGAMLAVGPSSVAQALCAACDEASDEDGALVAAETRPMRDGPVLALVGSLSPVTRAQVAAARRFARIDVDPSRLIGNASYSKALHEKARDLLRAQHVMLVTEQPSAVPAQAQNVAAATGALLRAVTAEARLSRLIVAGGDTSSHAVSALDIWGLSYRAPMGPGAPLCSIHSDDPGLDGLDIVLKGGQMGSENFFEAVLPD
jgi:3-oxoisoapionate kinase